MYTYPRSSKRSNVELPLATDIEQSALIADSDSESGKD